VLEIGAQIPDDGMLGIVFGPQRVCAGPGGLSRRLRLRHRDARLLLGVELRLDRGARRRRLGFGGRHPRQVDDEPLQRLPGPRVRQRVLERGETRVQFGAQGVELVLRSGGESGCGIQHRNTAGPIIVLVCAGR
jgi:hypothetical protein